MPAIPKLDEANLQATCDILGDTCNLLLLRCSAYGKKMFVCGVFCKSTVSVTVGECCVDPDLLVMPSQSR